LTPVILAIVASGNSVFTLFGEGARDSTGYATLIGSGMPVFKIYSIALDRTDDTHILIHLNMSVDIKDRNNFTIIYFKGAIYEWGDHSKVGELILLDQPIIFSREGTSRIVYLMLVGDKDKLDRLQKGENTYIVYGEVEFNIDHEGLALKFRIPI
jgi:hypothetical protein